jgi:hypothetical protein
VTDKMESLIYLAVGLNGVANVYCEQHGWIEAGGTYKGGRPWTVVSAVVNEHLARYHSDVSQEVL